MQETINNTKMVKILNKFNCQSFPLDETAIEISEEDLQQIGITKCFDVENNCVIDYTGLSLEEKATKIKRIIELKQLLSQSDFRAIKYAEGLYTEEEYLPYKEQRQSYRDEINALEQELEG